MSKLDISLLLVCSICSSFIHGCKENSEDPQITFKDVSAKVIESDTLFVSANSVHELLTESVGVAGSSVEYLRIINESSIEDISDSSFVNITRQAWSETYAEDARIQVASNSQNISSGDVVSITVRFKGRDGTYARSIHYKFN